MTPSSVTVNSLASMLSALEHYDEAGTLFKEAVDRRSHLLGPTHPKSLVSVASFAHMLTKSGDFEGAEPMHRRAYEGRKGQPDATIPRPSRRVSTSANQVNLVNIAKLVFLRNAVDRRVATLGAEHPRTLNAKNA